jgi:pyruvate dehydrogenase E2 component (dihydrolipoamide acetyltransferase)
MDKVVMPKMGDTMEEGKILSWRKQEGDPVKKGDALAEIETEKVNIEAESFFAGVLRKILVPAGETVPVGTPIALVGDPSESLGDAAGAAPQAAAASAASAASQSQPTAVPAAPAAPAAPPRRPEPVPVGVAGSGNGRTPVASAAGMAAATSRIFISPIARRIAAEHQLDVTQIHGSGPGGRILKEDIEAALTRQPAGPAEAPAAPVEVPIAPPATPVQPIPAAAAGEEFEAVPLSQMRKTIARRLQQSMQTAPHFYMTVSIDTTKVAELRASVNEYAGGLPEPIKVTLNDFIIKAVALTLGRFPDVNVSFDAEGGRLLRKKHINIGIAVALDRGLIVPVVRDADRRSVLDIAREAHRLAGAARNNTLKSEEIQGGTFSVSNAGMFGVESFTAVINPPESAILAVGAAVPTPVVEDGQVVVRDQMKVTLSSDHRAIDGATSARFLQELKRLLEQPMALLV